jgi:outer membrane protein OmpA-like peptidoglycan-associated protein
MKAQTPLNQRILFQPDSVTVMPSQTAQIEMMAEYIKSHPGTTIIVAGFVSSLTNAQKADEIAQKRADTVRDILVNNYSVSSECLIAIGVGRGKRFEQEEFNEVVSFFKK